MKTSRRRLAWLLFYLLLLTGMFYCAYRWSMEAAPLKGYIGFWPEEWTTSGQAWAKDRFGPVVLFWGGLDNPGWSLSEESNSQLRTFWKECETFWRLTFFCWSMWACGLAGLFGGAKCRESVYGDNEGKKRQTIRRKRNAALVASLVLTFFHPLLLGRKRSNPYREPVARLCFGFLPVTPETGHHLQGTVEFMGSRMGSIRTKMGARPLRSCSASRRLLSPNWSPFMVADGRNV